MSDYVLVLANDVETLKVRTPLFNGDWVKTGDNASAELFFSNGTLYTVGANALLEIYAQVNPITARKNNAVTMQVGSVEVATTDNASTVRTPGTQVVVDSESTTQVGVDKQKSTSVVAAKGTASVAPAAGGTAVKINTGQKVSASAQGSLSPVKNLLMPPALLAPGGFVHGNLPGWEKAVCNVVISPAMGARFSQLLVTLEHDGQCQGNTGTAQYFIYLIEGSASTGAGFCSG